MRVLRLLATIVVAAGVLVASARAQDPPGREEQVQRIRQLPADEKRRLKQALDRFNALPAAQRDALRAKARAVGADRLGELAGRDFTKLRQKHVFVQRETDEVMRLLGGPERFAKLAPDELAYVRDLVTRAFQRYCRQRLLESASLDAQFDKLAPAEQRARREKAADAAIQRLRAEKSPEEISAYAALPPAEQKRERMRLLMEWRLRQTTDFAKRFEGFRLLRILDMDPEERRKLVANQVRWHQLASLLHTDGGDRETLRMLGQLRCDERAQVALVWEKAQDQSPADRRALVTDKIRELYGASTFDAERMQRPSPRLPEILRERARRERERTRRAPARAVEDGRTGEDVQPVPPRER